MRGRRIRWYAVRVFDTVLVALLLISLGLAVMVLVGAVALFVRRGRPGVGKRWAVFLIAMVMFAGSVAIVAPALVRARCGAHSLEARARFKMLGVFLAAEARGSDALPPRLSVSAAKMGLHTPPPWPCAFWRWDAYPIVGAWTYGDFRDGRVDLQALDRLAAASPAAENWEQVGPFLLTRERAAAQTTDGRVVLGVSFVVGPTMGGEGDCAVLYADNRVKIEGWGGGWVEADRAAREELGLSAPPDWAAHRERFLDRFGD